MLSCPLCGGDLHRTRVAGFLQQLRKRMTVRRPYRCEHCAWHGWRSPPDPTAGPSALVDTPLTPDLVALDHASLSVHDVVVERAPVVIDFSTPDRDTPEETRLETRPTGPAVPGCPQCGAGRLKRASIPFFDAAVELMTTQRRYRCADCGWTGRRRRLRRRTHDQSARRASRAVTVGFVIGAVAILLIVGGLSIESCDTPAAAGDGSGQP